MNVEEARRAILRRDEDTEWLRLMHKFQSGRGEVMHREQQAAREAKSDVHRELVQALYEYNVAQAKVQRSSSEATEEKKRAQLQEAEIRRRDLIERRHEKRHQAAREKADDESKLEESFMRRDAELRREKQLQEERDRRVEQRVLSQSKQNTGSPSKTSQGTPTKELQTSTTPDPKLEERNLLELRRLQNLLRVRQKAQDEKEREAQRRKALELAAQQKGTKLEEEALREQQRHIELMEKFRPRPSDILPPIRRASPDERSRTSLSQRTPSVHDSRTQQEDELSAVRRSRIAQEEQRRQHQRELLLVEKREQEAHRQRETDRRIEKERRRAEEERIAELTRLNLERIRKAKEAEAEQRKKLYTDDFQSAKIKCDIEAQEQRNFVEALKQQEKVRAEVTKEQRIQHQQHALIVALERRKETSADADMIRKRREEDIKNKKKEQGELSHNRRKAWEQSKLREHQQEEIAAVLRVKESERRRQAQEEMERERLHKRGETEQAWLARQKNLERYREEKKAHKEAEVAPTDQFYRAASLQRIRRETVPPTVHPATASDEPLLPPHPEMAEIEREMALFVKGVEAELQMADAKARQLKGRIQ